MSCRLISTRSTADLSWKQTQRITSGTGSIVDEDALPFLNLDENAVELDMILFIYIFEHTLSHYPSRRQVFKNL